MPLDLPLSDGLGGARFIAGIVRLYEKRSAPPYKNCASPRCAAALLRHGRRTGETTPTSLAALTTRTGRRRHATAELPATPPGRLRVNRWRTNCLESPAGGEHNEVLLGLTVADLGMHARNACHRERRRT
jgi:hypothetical protein